MISINFLPSEQKERNRWQLITRFVTFYCILFVSVAAVFIVILFLFNYFLKIYRDDLKNQVEGFNQGKLAVQVAEAEKKIKDENKKIEAVAQLIKSSSHWSIVLEDIISNVPAGVSLTSLSLQEQGKIAVMGHADVREQLLEFKANLEKSKYIATVDLPFSDLTKRTDVDFGISFILKEGALQDNIK